jgi:hypothetical protein
LEVFLVDYSNYQYVTPDYAQELMNCPTTHPQFAKAAADLITLYIRRHKPDPDLLINQLHELAIRRLLHWEHQLKQRIPLDMRDYWIKTHLGLIPWNREYEEKVLGLGEAVVH